MNPDQTPTDRIAVVVPTYNEADNIEELVSRLVGLDVGVDVFIVDDDSPDGTGQIADRLAACVERVNVIHRTGPRGYAGACRDGLVNALARGYGIILTMDADLSHDPDRIPALIDAVRAGADLAIGSRYVEGGELVVDWGPMRRATSQLGSAYARTMVGTSARDCTSGFRAYRAGALRDARVSETASEGYCFLIEVLSRGQKARWAITEVPITYVDRRAGKSKISRAIILEALVLTTKLGVRRLVGG